VLQLSCDDSGHSLRDPFGSGALGVGFTVQAPTAATLGVNFTLGEVGCQQLLDVVRSAVPLVPVHDAMFQ